MNEEKYENIKKRYCIEVTQVGFKCPEGIEGYNMIVGDPLTYNYNNGVVSFIDEKGVSYVSPTYEIIRTLEQAGYTQGPLFVPFSDHKFLMQNQKWQILHSEFARIRNENKDVSAEFNIETLDNNMKL